MRQVLQDFRSGNLRVEDVPRPALQAGGVLVDTSYSCVSAGTEESVIKLARKNVLNKARERPDLAKKVFEKAKNDGLISTYRAVKGRLESPSPLGYSCAGKVIAVGDDVTGFSRGDRVACAGAGYASHADVVFVPENLVAPVPDNVALEDAAFTTLGAIAMQGVRRADISPGENVAVVGLGLVGQLVVQILNAYGSPVVGADIDPRQVERGLEIGMDEGAVIGEEDVEGITERFSNGHGVDATIIAASTDSDDPVELAGEITREHGRISVVGEVGMDIPRSSYYEKELDFRISRSYGPGRYDRTYEENGLSYPISQVRWTENRNMREFLRLLSTERISLESMKTHRFSIDNALEAYDLVLENPDDESFTGILLEYGSEDQSQTVKLASESKQTRNSETLSVGLIGGGNFAKTTILPTIGDISALSIRGVASATGKTATGIAKDVGAAYSTTDYEEIVTDDDIDIVIVATRNDTHAEIGTSALNHNKDVHIEKPLAITEDGLRSVIRAEQGSSGRLMVGFNRRFSPSARQIRSKFENRTTPLMLNYRVNAESIPDDHWVNDPEEGGGRIISEVCHFVDLFQYLTDSLPAQVFASSIPEQGAVGTSENVSIVVKLADGSTGTIQYTSLGDRSLPKESVEVFGSGQSGTIDNFKRGRLNLRQDKGHSNEFTTFIEAIQNGEPSPISVEDLVATTLSTFRVHDSVASAQPEQVDHESFIADLDEDH